MTTALTIDQLSFESADIAEDELRASEATIGDHPNPLHSDEFKSIDKVLDTYKVLVERGCVCRADIDRISDLAEEYPQLKKLVDDYPAGSFSQEPSRVNYQVSMEGFASSAYTAIVNALKSLIRYMLETAKSFWGYLTKSGARTEAVDKFDGRLVAIQDFLVKADEQLAATPNYRTWKKRGFDTAHHNAAKRWNGLKDRFLETPETQFAAINDIVGIFQVKYNPYVEMVEEFLGAISSAVTERDVDDAIVIVSGFNPNNERLAATAQALGWKDGGNRNSMGPVTPFQAQASFILTDLRGAENNRTVQLNRETFQSAIVSTKIEALSPAIKELIKTTLGRTGKVMDRLQGFNANQMNAGLEQVYIKKLIPTISVLTSILQGFTLLEQALGMLVTTRDAVILSVCEGGLSVVKTLNTYAQDSRELLSVEANAVMSGAAKDVFASFH